MNGTNQKTKISKLTLLFAFLFIILALTENTFARDRERDFRPGRGNRRGNENSQRPGRVDLSQPSYGGNGCPQGTMSVIMAPDNLSFTMLFDQFVAEVVQDQRSRRDNMICDAIIPITIPEGMQMEITRVDFRGFVGLPVNSRGVVNSMFSFRGRGPGGRDGDRMVMKFRFDGPMEEEYTISSDAFAGTGQVVQTEVSPCGGQARLRVVNEVRVNSRNREQAMVSLDSIDGTSNAVYYLNWRTCRR